MATVKFLYRSTKVYGDITTRLSHLNKIDLFANTGYKSNKAFWFDSRDNKLPYPKGRDVQAKADNLKLVNLEKHILEHFNEDYNSGVSIDKEWLVDVIDVFFLRKVRSNTHSEYLIDNIQALNLSGRASGLMFRCHLIFILIVGQTNADMTAGQIV